MRDTVFGIILLVVVSFGMLTISAKANVNLSVTISPTPPVIMEKYASKVFAATVAGGTPPYQYSWTLYDNLQVPVASGTGNPWNCTVPSYAFVGTGLVTVVVTDSQCDIGSTNESVQIFALLVSVSPTSVTMDVGQCQVFNSSIQGGLSPYSYQWFLDSSGESGATDASWAYTPSSAGTHTVYEKAKDATGAVATSNTVSVTVSAAPSVSISPTSVTLDVDQSVTFLSTVSGGTSPYSYQWYLDGNAISGATSSSWSYSPSASGAHTVYIKVTDSASTPVTAQSNSASLTVSGAFSVAASPTPVTMDVGQSQVFTSTVSGGTSPYSYQWYLDGNAISGATSSSWSYSPSASGAHTVYIKVTDSASTPVIAQSNIVSVTVNSAPSVSISPASATMDVGQSQVFTSSVSGGTCPFFYQWYLNGTAISGATSGSYTFTPSSRGHYNFYCSITDSANARAQSNTVPTVLNPALYVSISTSFVTMDVGQSQTLNSTVTGGTLPYIYQWCLNGSVIVGATISSYIFTPSSHGHYIFYVNVTDGVNSKVGSSVVIATVNSALSIVISPASVTLDVGQSQNFSSSTSGGTWPYSCQWYLNNSAVKDATSSTWTFTPTSPGSYSVYLNVTDKVGVKVKSDVVMVTVNTAPSVTISPSSVTVDIGQSQTFTSSVYGGTGSRSYQWYLDGTPVSSATDATWSLTPSATGVYNVYVVITDSLGVNATSNAAMVTVNGALSVAASPSPVTLDVGQSQVFTLSVTGGTFPYSYQWYLNGQAVGTGVTYNFSAKSAGSDSIYVTVTDSASSPYAATSNTATVTVYSAPTVSVTPASWTLDVGQSETFTATASGGSGTYLSYQWYVDGQLQLGQTSTFVYSPSAGSQGTHSITVKVTDSLDATSPQSLSATVTVSAALVAPAVTSLSSTVDQGQTSILTSSSVITGTSPYSYQWSEMAPGSSAYSAIGGATLTSYSFVTSVSTTVGVWYFKLGVMDATGATVTSNVSLVTVNLVPSVSISPPSTTLDAGQSQLFASCVYNGAPSFSYQWYLDGVAVSGAIGDTWTFTPLTAGSYTVCLNVTDAVGVVATSNAAHVIVNGAPSVTLSPSSATMDVGQPWPFQGALAGGTSPYTTELYLNGTPVATRGISPLTTLPPSHYTVYVKINDAAGVTATSNTVNLTLNPALFISILPTAVAMSVGRSQTLTAIVSGGTSPYSYQWYLNGTAVLDATNQSWTFTPTSSGSYLVCVKVNDSVAAQVTSNTTIVNVTVWVVPPRVSVSLRIMSKLMEASSGASALDPRSWSPPIPV